MQALVVGVVVWAFVAVLKWAVHVGLSWTMALLERADTVLAVLVPLLLGAGCVAALSRYRSATVHYRDGEERLHTLNAVEGDGLERAIALYFASEPTFERALLGNQGLAARWRLPTFSLAVRKMLASWCTLCSGGAGGLEASVTLVGESTAAGLFKPRSLSGILPASPEGKTRVRLGPLQRGIDWWRGGTSDDLQAAQLCGIAAAIATLLGTPFAAAFFAIEVIYRRRPIIDRLIYALVSALIAFFLNHLVTGAHSPFPYVPSSPPLYVGRYYLALSALAITMGVLSSGFRALRGWADHAFHTSFSPVQRHLAGALGAGLLAIVAVSLLAWLGWKMPAGASGTRALWLVLGPGENIIDWSLDGQIGLGVALISLAARFAATVCTIASGGSAGLLFPTLTFGCLTASAWAALFDFDAALLVVPAMTASLASVANVPLAAIMLVVEGFGAQWTVPSMFVLVLASVFAHRNSIYRAQRESFDRGQILPGVSVRRIRVPTAWAGMDLRSLGVRERYSLTVIGMVDRREQSDGTLDERIVLNPPPTQALSRGDMLIVLGEDERIDRFAAESDEENSRRVAGRE
ncbi:MAG TPA: chloride channel protein [Polyangiales bacterium]|nr:chloride channel protein [Polyangiales bacterium]